MSTRLAYLMVASTSTRIDWIEKGQTIPKNKAFTLLGSMCIRLKLHPCLNNIADTE